jgi:hypothetical protein
VAGSYVASPTYGGDGNYATVSGSGSVVVANPPLNVTSIVSQNNGGTAGKIEVGDTFSITFGNALNPTTVNQAVGGATVTLCSNNGGCSNASSTNINISGLSVPAGFTVGSNYEKSAHTSTATGTLVLSNGNKTVKLTITQITSGSTNLKTGSASTFTFVPSSTIRDTNGTQPNPSGYFVGPPSGAAMLLW